LQAGAVIGKAWDTYKAHWRHLLPIAFVVYVLISLLILLLGALLGWFGALVGSLVSIAGIFWLQGALVLAIDDVRDGRADLSLSETLDRVSPRLGTLALAGLLAGIAIGLGLLLLIVPGLYLLTIWLVIIPAIMLEGCGVSESFGRSHELARGYGLSGLSITQGARVIDSTPPATRSDASPTLTARLASIAASRPEPHSRLTVAPGIDVGRPASSTAMRATLRLSSPAWLASPK